MSRSLITQPRLAITQPRAVVAASSLLTGLVDLFRLGEASGNRVGVNGTVLSPTNAPGNALGKLGNGLFITATNQSLSGSAASFHPGAGDFTVWGWSNLDASVNTDAGLMSVNAASPNREWDIQRQAATSRLQILVSRDGNTDNVTASSPSSSFPLSQWVFWTAQRTGNTLRVRLNNGAWTSTALTGTIFTSASSLQICNGNHNAAKGIHNAFGYASRALTDPEIALLWSNGNGFAYPWSRGQLTTSILRAAA